MLKFIFYLLKADYRYLRFYGALPVSGVSTKPGGALGLVSLLSDLGYGDYDRGFLGYGAYSRGFLGYGAYNRGSLGYGAYDRGLLGIVGRLTKSKDHLPRGP